MGINKVTGHIIVGVKKHACNYKNFPIRLRQNAQDAFVKSQRREFTDYLEKFNKNSHTAFLYNPRLTSDEKLKLSFKTNETI